MQKQKPPPNYLQEQSDIHPAPAPYLDPTANLRGGPGYRTQPGRSGYDPLDTDFESAHIFGVLLHSLIKCKFRTWNPLHIVLLSMMGISAALPFVFGAGIILGGDLLGGLLLLLVFSPIWMFTVLIVVNLILSFLVDDPNHPNKGDLWL